MRRPSLPSLPNGADWRELIGPDPQFEVGFAPTLALEGGLVRRAWGTIGTVE